MMMMIMCIQGVALIFAIIEGFWDAVIIDQIIYNSYIWYKSSSVTFRMSKSRITLTMFEMV